MQLGELIAQLGHTLVLIPTTGTVAAVRMGFEAHSNKTSIIPRNLFGESEYVIVFANDAILKALANIHIYDAPGDDNIFLYDAENIQHAVEGARLAIEDRRNRA
jgi:hypothetical protein